MSPELSPESTPEFPPEFPPGANSPLQRSFPGSREEWTWWTTTRITAICFIPFLVGVLMLSLLVGVMSDKYDMNRENAAV